MADKVKVLNKMTQQLLMTKLRRTFYIRRKLACFEFEAE